MAGKCVCVERKCAHMYGRETKSSSTHNSKANDPVPHCVVY